MKTNGIRVIITGTTGMVGEGVLHESITIILHYSLKSSHVTT